MWIAPLIAALGAMLCVGPVLFGMLVTYWPRPSTRFDHASLTEMVLDEGDVLAADPPHENCGCSACTFWREWHRTMT